MRGAVVALQRMGFMLQVLRLRGVQHMHARKKLVAALQLLYHARHTLPDNYTGLCDLAAGDVVLPAGCSQFKICYAAGHEDLSV